MGNYTIFEMFENPRRGRQARNFTTNNPKILDLKSSSEQIFSRKLPLGAPETSVFPSLACKLSRGVVFRDRLRRCFALSSCFLTLHVTILFVTCKVKRGTWKSLARAGNDRKAFSLLVIHTYIDTCFLFGVLYNK